MLAMKIPWTIAAGILIAVFAAPNCPAQEAVPVGKGSYASAPPPSADEKSRALQSQQLYLVKEDGRPIPTNKWWTQLVVSRFAKSLWSYPMRVDPSEKGLDIYFPIRWMPGGNDPACNMPLNVSGKDFVPADARAKDWSDWLVSFRLGQKADRYMDVTLGEGMPYAWIECHGVQPVLTLPKGAEAKLFALDGKVIQGTYSGDCIGITYSDRSYGIFAPDGTKFNLSDSGVSLEFSGKAEYLVVCPLPTSKDLTYFHRYAYAIPRNTEVSWQYDAAAGRVTTNWKITTEVLKGTEKQIIQGWIPHHYRKTTNNLVFNHMDYISPRGPLRCAAGNEFVISYPYNGILPNLPAPKPVGASHDYDPSRMHAYLEDLASKPEFGADTYWGGKDILRYGQDALMAQQTKDSTYNTFRDELHKAMADWFTYTPGKKDHYFTFYPRWKALVGVKTSYGSEGFNDHHFHYGYYTFASALLAMHDPQFAVDYGPMATLVAKEYANWDRADLRFPFLRTFDLWAGHSWAGGTSSPGGENQESTSEAVQSWAGLIYLGEALGDQKMRDTGIMGYAAETQATLEYWFNTGGDVFPPEWKHPITGMVWSGGKVYGTYFTGDPAWIYGIQWLPASPMLSYLVQDPAFARKSYENMCKDYEAHELADAAKKPKSGKKPHEAQKATIESFGPGLGSVMLGYVLMYDPSWACEQLDTLWNQPGDKIAHDASEMAIMYYLAHSTRTLGDVDWTCHGSSPTSMAYKNSATKSRTYVVWNPSTKSETVVFYEGAKAIGQMVAAPQSLSSIEALAPIIGVKK
jgi:endoglucanase Acf2